MKHLSMKEIRAFATIDALSLDDLKIAERVNGHIRHCEKCASEVKAVLAVYDKFSDFTAVDLALKEIHTLEEKNKATER